MLTINRELAVAFSVITPSDEEKDANKWSLKQPASPLPPPIDVDEEPELELPANGAAA